MQMMGCWKKTRARMHDWDGRREETAEYMLQVIKGWTEALQLMCEGDKWELHIPYDMAYGEHGSPPKIPPCASPPRSQHSCALSFFIHPSHCPFLCMVFVLVR